MEQIIEYLKSIGFDVKSYEFGFYAALTRQDGLQLKVQQLDHAQYISMDAFYCDYLSYKIIPDSDIRTVEHFKQILSANQFMKQEFSGLLIS